MPENSFRYIVFPSEVISNTYDFEVQQVVHHGQTMRGVFSKRSISAQECSLFIGVYSGYRKSNQENALKISNYAARHAVDKETAIRKTVAYSFSLKKIDPGYLLDPTDEEGNIRPEFVPFITCYINEPPPGYTAKSVFAYNRPRKRYEVWLLQPVEKEEEIFLYYGKYYLRDYPFDDCEKNNENFHFIPDEAILIPDRRNIPPPLVVPDFVPESSKIQNV